MENNPLKFQLTMNAAVRHFIKKFWLIFFSSLFFCVPLVLSYIFFWDNQKATEYFMFRRASYREYQAVSIVLTAAVIGAFFVYKILLFLILNEEKPRFFSLLLKAVRKLPGYIFFKLVLLAKTFIWLLVFVIPGIVQFVYWSTGELIYLLEGKSIKDSLEKSKLLVMPYRNKYLDHLFYVFMLSCPFWYSPRYFLITLAEVLQLKGFLIPGEIIRHLIPFQVMIIVSFVLVFYFESYKALAARSGDKIIS